MPVVSLEHFPSLFRITGTKRRSRALKDLVRTRLENLVEVRLLFGEHFVVAIYQPSCRREGVLVDAIADLYRQR